MMLAAVTVLPPPPPPPLLLLLLLLRRKYRQQATDSAYGSVVYVADAWLPLSARRLHVPLTVRFKHQLQYLLRIRWACGA